MWFSKLLGRAPGNDAFKPQQTLEERISALLYDKATSEYVTSPYVGLADDFTVPFAAGVSSTCQSLLSCGSANSYIDMLRDSDEGILNLGAFFAYQLWAGFTRNSAVQLVYPEVTDFAELWNDVRDVLYPPSAKAARAIQQLHQLHILKAQADLQRLQRFQADLPEEEPPDVSDAPTPLVAERVLMLFDLKQKYWEKLPGANFFEFNRIVDELVGSGGADASKDRLTRELTVFEELAAAEYRLLATLAQQ
jgi:hypothetical protein